jgi:PKHD-type hydroxylase
MIDFGINAQEEDKELLQYYWFESAFSPAQCKEIIKIGKSHPQEGGQIFADNSGKEGTEKNETRNSTVRWIDYQDPRLSWLTDELGRMSIEANKQLFQLDLYGFTEKLQFTEYEGKGSHYDWHPDIGPRMNKRKLSIVIQLSDEEDYEGGGLVINTGNIVTPSKKQGSVILFPSFLLHKVEPLKSGNRYSLVCWISGTPWR